jgi:hypothetical protein
MNKNENTSEGFNHSAPNSEQPGIYPGCSVRYI